MLKPIMKKFIKLPMINKIQLFFDQRGGKITVVKTLDQVPSGCALQAIGPECTVHVLVKDKLI